MKKKSLKIVFISWAALVRRTKSLSGPLSAKDYYIEYLKGTSLIFVPFRYLLQSIHTLLIFILERPHIIITQNPPIITPLIAYLYCLCSKAELIIDSHTGAFIGKWTKYIRLHKYLSHKAITTITTSKTLKRRVENWGAKAFVLEDRLPEISIVQTNKSNTRFRICVINSFLPDEPLDEVWKAAQMLPDIDFYVTGKISRAPKNLITETPVNLNLTDFIPDDEYFRLLNTVDAIMVLTTRDLTMLCGAYEAVAVEKPLITSDWPVLKNYFKRGTIFVDNTHESIVKGIKDIKSKQVKFKNDIKELKRHLIPLWDKKFNEFIEIIYTAYNMRKNK